MPTETTTGDTPIIHIAPDIGYLFPAEANTARTMCGKLVKNILACGEFIGTRKNLNPKLQVCQECAQATSEQNG